MTSPFFSLIFVNYQSARLLKRAIASWEAPLRNFAYEIIIVNNDSQENEAITALAVPDKVIVKNLNENVGFGKANNQAAELARGKWFFLLNPDTEYLNGSIEALLPVLEAYPLSLGGIRLVDGKGREELWSAGPCPTLFRLIRNHLLGPISPLPWAEPVFHEIDWVSGAALFVSRESFQILGGFSEEFFLYFEDVDLAKRAEYVGIARWRYPGLTVRHIGGASQGIQSTQKAVYYASERQYFKKHRPWLETKMLSCLHQLLYSA